MKKVLIVAELSHASPRIPDLAKYLPEFDWEPIILTGSTSKEGLHQPPNEIFEKCRVIQTLSPNIIASLKRRIGLKPEKTLQEQVGFPLLTKEKKKSFFGKIINFIKEIIAYPDALRGWKPFAVKRGSEVIEREDIKALISSSSPIIAHIIAKELKKKYKIPWIADLRDLWTQNHDYQYSKVRKFFEQKLELKTLKDANALVTVSPIWADRLKKLHKRDTVYTITNGFDPEKINIPPADLTNKFTITYTGSFYPEKQNPSKLFSALRELIDEKKIDPTDIEVRFYGPKQEWLEKEIEEYQLSDIAKQYGLIPREISFQKQRESQILLLLNWEDYKERGWYPLKNFEYLAAQRPILVVGGSGDDVVKKLLSETKSGVYGKEIEDIKDSFLKFYLEYKQKGKVSYFGDVEKINKYSYKEMAEKFAKILNQITSYVKRN